MDTRKAKHSVITTVSVTTAAIQRNIQIMRITLALTVLSFCTFSITLISSQWVIITYPNSFYDKRKNLYIDRSSYGVILECIFARKTKNDVSDYKCDYHLNRAHNTSIPAEQTLVGMIRTMVSFSVIHILLLIITFICGVYSIRAYRYTYKRLTAMLYILTAGSLVVCLEVLSTIFRHTSDKLPDIYPSGTNHSYSICYVISWVIFSQLIISSGVFFACGKKRKGTFDDATEEEADANLRVDLGRF